MKQMQNSQSNYLTPYHQQRNKEALQGVKQMQQQPLSREQFIKQSKMLEQQAKNYYQTK